MKKKYNKPLLNAHGTIKEITMDDCEIPGKPSGNGESMNCGFESF